MQKLPCVCFSLSKRGTFMCRNSHVCVSVSAQGIHVCVETPMCVFQPQHKGHTCVQKLLCVCFSLFYGVVLLTALVMGESEPKQLDLKNHVSSCKRKSKPESFEASGFWKLHDLKTLSYTCLTGLHCPREDIMAVSLQTPSGIPRSSTHSYCNSLWPRFPVPASCPQITNAETQY